MQIFLKNFIENRLKEVVFLVVFLFSVFVSFSTTSVAYADFNQQINYQGKLSDASGSTVPDGDYNMRFWLHSGTSTPTSSALWTEERTNANKVSVKNGLFSVMLGEITNFSGIDFNQTLYLGVEIGGVVVSPVWDGEMSPRKIIGAVPAAFVAERALSADTISGIATSSLLRSDEAGILSATTSSTSTLLTLIQNGTGSLLRLLSSSTEVLTVLNNGNLGLGTTTPNSKLTIQGTAGNNNPTFTIASSSGQSTLSMLANGNLELPGQLISAGIKWATSSAAEANQWNSVTYGNGLFVAVASDGTNRVMTSPDGINWTARPAAEQNDWRSITYGNGLFVAVAFSGTNRVMTSPDGINWTPRAAAEQNGWYSITYGNGLFVAVAYNGTNRVMTSPDGINWTARAAAEANSWTSITYGNGLFVAVAYSGTNRVMTSPDGITWTSVVNSEIDKINLISITYGNGLFVAVAQSGDIGVVNRVIVSKDNGVSWSLSSDLFGSIWNSITYGNGLFVAVNILGGAYNEFAYSTNGIDWSWNFLKKQEGHIYRRSVVYANGLFVSVGNGNVSISGTLNSISLAHNNIYQGGMSIYDSLRIGTTTSSIASLLIQGTPDKNPFVVASSSGDSLLTLDKKGNLGLGTTTPNSKLTIQGTAGNNNPTFTIASSSGKTTLSMLADGNLELPGQLISAGINWTPRAAAEQNVWNSITYGNGLFVAVARVGTNRVMTSPDGINWTARTAAEQNSWNSITYGNGLFVAVASGGTNRVMTSPDGINWTARTAAEQNGWNSITYGNGLFVAIAFSGTNRVMTSPDGINWTARTAAEQNGWNSITYGNGLFVAVADGGTNRVMTSPDGINWTARTAAELNYWYSITYGNGLFVAVAYTGTHRVMTSPDGINWTARSAAEDNEWNSITYGNGLFVAVAYTGTHRVMTSPDGINWTARTAAEQNGWNSITYGNGLFVAVAGGGTNLVMTSGTLNSISLAHNNIYQGGMSIYDSLRIGTTTSSIASLLVQGTPDKNPFVVASSSGDSLLTLDKEGNLGLGTSTPTAKLTVAGAANITSSLSVSATTTTENLFVNGTSTTSNLVVSGTGTIQKLFVNENLGLGTTTAVAKLAMAGVDFASSGVFGLDQNFTLKTNISNAVQVANNLFLKNTNTATTTIVGGLWKIEDSTTFGNTVRGLEIQVDRGTNSKGENTAISGYARTFGVKGVTSGEAGGVFEPAGVFAETKGFAQGNALRAYSSSVTTAALVNFFQDTSDFEGTGLLMNFGNAGGSFSSSSSLFIDLKNGGTSVFTVGARGMLTIGDGTTNHLAGLQIGYGGICIDDDGSCNASTSGRISAVDYYTGNSDLAETYFSNEELETGEVVYLKGGLSVGKASTSTKDLVLGVVSTKPGLLLGHDDSSLEEGEESFPIALSGRVPVRLSNENGEIKAGDELILSSIPGVVMKATSTGLVVGIALEDFEEERAYSKTYINQFGDNIKIAQTEPLNKDDDPRLSDGCSFGGGSAFGEEECEVKEGDFESFDDDFEGEEKTKEEILTELETIKSEEVTLENGQTVKVGQIVMFVNLKQKYLDKEGEVMIKALLAKSNETISGEEITIWEKLVDLANRFVDGVLSVFTLRADRVEVRDTLCVDDVCVTADDLRQILQGSGGNSSNNGENNQGNGGGTEKESGDEIEENNGESEEGVLMEEGEVEIENEEEVESGVIETEEESEENNVGETIFDFDEEKEEVIVVENEEEKTNEVIESEDGGE